MAPSTGPPHFVSHDEQGFRRPHRRNHSLRAIPSLEGNFDSSLNLYSYSNNHFQEHLFELEADEKNTAIEANKAIYVVYPDETAEKKNWRVQAVPVSPESFESRKALPEAWRGLRDEELSRVSGIEGGIFIHASGFIGGKYLLNL